MQIALTKKLADAMNVKPGEENPEIAPLFCWTANWINTFDRRKEDMVVLINNATQFTVTVYGVKRTGFKNIEQKILDAIRNTLLSMSLNSEVIDEYMRQAKDITFVSNRDRKLTAWVNRKGLEAAFVVGKTVNESWSEVKYEDTLGRIVSRNLVGYSGGNHSDSYVPAEKMIEELIRLTGKPAYKYRAFELLVTLDLEIYKATRRLIVPAKLEFSELHLLLQNVFDWDNCHLYDFAVFDGKNRESTAVIVLSEKRLDYSDNAVLITNHKLSDYLPQYKHLLYTYDMGDNWEHEIELIREIEEHDAESPYLLEAVGQTPPENVGGVGGFIDFYNIMKDENHPDYAEMKEWVGYWSPELWKWKSRSRSIHI